MFKENIFIEKWTPLVWLNVERIQNSTFHYVYVSCYIKTVTFNPNLYLTIHTGTM